MKMRVSILPSCGLILSFCFSALSGATKLEGRVVDDATGVPLAARVAITDVHGKPVEVEGKHEHVQQLDKRWCYVDGTFAASLPDSGVAIAIRRGLETRPLLDTVSGQAAGAVVAKTFRLRRWIDMRSKGYMSGDLHAHGPAVTEAALEMKAEDLNALNLLILNGLPAPNDGLFKGKPEEIPGSDSQVFIGQEVVDWQLGHLTLTGLKSLVSGYPTGGGTLEYWQSNPDLDIMRAARAARQQNALVSLAHFENLPGFESPVALALSLLDAIELPTWSDPMQLPAHLGPWENSGMALADFTPMRGADLYYQLLNAGFRLPLAAGTDKIGPEIALGGNRVYVPTRGRLDYAEWLAGVKAGTGFVTNGPILEFDVDGHLPGETVDFQGNKTVKARATARSILPFTTVEILLNGRVVGHKLRMIQNNPPVDGVYTMRVEAIVNLDRSGWLAARAFSNPDIAPRLLARESSVFSHTSPVYFLQDGRKVREEASVVYLRKYVKALLHWLSAKPAFANDEDRAAVERDAQQALKFYEGL